MNKSDSKKNGGFTLIELMVAISIFSLVMVISMGAIFTVINSNRKAQSLRSVMDNLNFTVDSITRTIRFGTNYHCGASGILTDPQNCPAGESTMTVMDSDGNTVTFTKTGSQITRSINGGTPIPFTSPDVVVEEVSFRVFGSAPYDAGADLFQPRALIVIKGYVDARTESKSTFALQTTVSQRTFDFESP